MDHNNTFKLSKTHPAIHLLVNHLKKRITNVDKELSRKRIVPILCIQYRNMKGKTHYILTTGQWLSILGQIHLVVNFATIKIIFEIN